MWICGCTGGEEGVGELVDGNVTGAISVHRVKPLLQGSLLGKTELKPAEPSHPTPIQPQEPLTTKHQSTVQHQRETANNARKLCVDVE